MELLTNSRRACFQRCRREHLYNYILRQRPRHTAEALAFGTLFHKALEGWWLAWQRGQGAWALTVALQAIDLAWQEAGGDLNPFDLAKVQALVTGYHFRWRDAMPGIQVLAVEAQFEAPLRNPTTGRSSRTYRLAGKLDVVLQVTDAELAGFGRAGGVYFMEHKSTSSDISPEKDYWLRLRIDGQVSTYYAGAEALGYPVEACIYDVAMKPGQHPKRATPCEVDHETEVCDQHFTKGRRCKPCEGKGSTRQAYTNPSTHELMAMDVECADCGGSGWAEPRRLRANLIARDETPEEYRDRLLEVIGGDPNRYFGRAEVIRLPDDQLEHESDAWWTAQAMRWVAAQDVHPRNPDACVRYGRFCSYYDVCTGAADLYDPVRFRHSPVVHEELDTADEPKEEVTVAE